MTGPSAPFANREKRALVAPMSPSSVCSTCLGIKGVLGGELAGEGAEIVRLVEPPQRVEDGLNALARPALAHIAAKLPLHVHALHGPAGEARNVVDLAG